MLRLHELLKTQYYTHLSEQKRVNNRHKQLELNETNQS